MTHETFMNRALELAEKASGNTSPNPLVGAVITLNNQIIGEGFHQEHGGPHAEVNAVNSVKDKSVLKNASIYVTLEPCSHYGKTPPCAELLVKHKFKEVIICNTDPNPEVAGNGIKLLEKSGIKVTQNVLSEKGEWLNRRFFTSHRKKRPYIILKWAQNQNGFMDSDRKDYTEKINWITSKELKILTHTWRAQEDAILVGVNTVLNDSPNLTTRHAAGSNPLRVVIDLNNRIPSDHAFLKQGVNTIIFSSEKKIGSSNTEYVHVTKKDELHEFILKELHFRKVNSLIVEGGSFTLKSFIESGLWDEARVLSAENSWESGLRAPALSGTEVESFKLGVNRIKTLKNT